MSDADGDSTMHSDHSSIDDPFDNDDSMLPDAAPSSSLHPASILNAPSTPSRFAHPPSSELSPPNSQGPSTSTYAFSSSSGAARNSGSNNNNNQEALPDSPSALLGSSSTSSAAGLNANGKRVHSLAMGSGTDGEMLAAAAAAGGGSNSAVQVGSGEPIGRAASGYEWDKPEDEPGSGWKNKKAVEEYHKAMEQVLDRQYMIKNRYGDPCVPAK